MFDEEVVVRPLLELGVVLGVVLVADLKGANNGYYRRCGYDEL